MNCDEKIARLEEEHRQMGDVQEIRDQRAKVKDKIRTLSQEIGEFSVRQFFVPLTCLKCARLGLRS